MKNKSVWILLVAALVAFAVVGTEWYHSVASLRDLRASELETLAVLLNEDQELLQVLQTDAALAKESGILGSYLASIRVDGLPKHAEMKQRLDRLAESNSAILALISVYTPHAKTATFKSEADKFQHYAIAWRDRWNSVMELFMAGGNYPVAETPFPKELIGAVQVEMEAAQRNL
jgi:hypothetical protein